MIAFDALGRHALGAAPASTAAAVSAEAGAYTVTGQDALFSVSAPLEVGTFAFAGQAVTHALSLPVEAGAFTLTGVAATTTAAFSLSCVATPAAIPIQFGFAPLGALALGQGQAGSVASTTFEIQGQNTLASLGIGADAGAFTVTGQDARLVEGYVLTADAGAFVVSGQPIGAVVSLPLLTGVFTISGGTATEFTRTVPKLRRFPRTGTTTISARSVGTGLRARAYGG